MITATGLPAPTLTRSRFAYCIPNGIHTDRATGIYEGEIVAYTDEALFQQTSVRIAFAERSGGLSQGPFASLNVKKGLGDDDRLVERNRAALMSALGFDRGICLVPNQVHGTDIVETCSALPCDVSAAWERAQQGADAVSIGCAQLAAILCYADCLPLILVAPDGTFSVVHCGWRGAVAGLAGKALTALSKMAVCQPSECNAYIGPYIHEECFEVGEEVAERFLAAFGASCVPDARHVSIGAAVTTDLAMAGLDPGRLADVGLCTVCTNDRFFSFRAQEGVCGRHAAIAVRLDGPMASDGMGFLGKEPLWA